MRKRCPDCWVPLDIYDDLTESGLYACIACCWTGPITAALDEMEKRMRVSKRELRRMLKSKEEMLADALTRAAHGTYPRRDGSVTVIGPECFTDERATVISYRGENYYTASEIDAHAGRRDHEVNG